MDFVNWVISRVDEVMAQIDIDRGSASIDRGKDSHEVFRRIPERAVETGAFESPDTADTHSARSVA